MTAKVTTTTPEPPKPEPKEPGKPQPQPSLPNTGTAASMLPVVGMILGLLGLAGFRKHKNRTSSNSPHPWYNEAIKKRGREMIKDTKMDAYVTRSGYRYYTPTQKKSEVTRSEEEKKWKQGLRWLGKAVWSGMETLPSVIAKAAVLMVTTPLMFLLFIFNLIKGLIATDIFFTDFTAETALSQSNESLVTRTL